MKKAHWGRRFLLAILLLAAGTLFFLQRSNTALQTTRFSPVIPDLPDGFAGCRIAVLSDLHSAVFGEENADLFAAVAAESPEYIFLLGDLEDAFHDRIPGYVSTLAEGFSAIAPTYYVTGNHEWGIGDVRELKKELEAGGVTVLSNETVPLERLGDTLYLAGIDDPSGFADQKTPETVAAELYAEYGDVCWFLLAHRNDHFESQYSLLGADLVLSGHGHGGCIRLPFTDGLISTDRSLFPTYTSGLYEANGSQLFVSRGLGNSNTSFRLFNHPEVAVLTLQKG